jgi:allantoinase
MSDLDLVLRGGTVVTPDGVRRADVGIAEGGIRAVEPELAGREEIDARGLHLFPGVIDAHLHFNEPGRADWEGFETGSCALAAGGGTLFFDMPLNAHPPTVDAESFNLKLAAARRQSLTDFAFWGGLVPHNLDHLEALAECGVIGFKAFMCSSGIEDFCGIDDRTLREGMKRAARLGLPVAVHAECENLTRRLSEERLSQGRTTVRDFLESRPVEAELEAIRRAVDIAGETGCALQVVHISCGAGIELVAEARRRGVNVTGETCPHYLTLTQEDMARIGATAKCAPPLRSEEHRQALWRQLLAGNVSNVGSDHSPSPPEMKQGTNFFKIWGGISGVQHTLPLLLTGLAREGDAGLTLAAALLSSRVAARFALPASKGHLAPGADADLVLVDMGSEFEVCAEDLLDRHRQSPYVGRKLRGRVVRTLLRGRTLFENGRIVAKPGGKFVPGPRGVKRGRTL